MSTCKVGALASIGWLALSSATLAAGPEVVQGPSADPECFTPWSADTQYFQWPAKEGPYRIALANGFIGNTWRIQMIQTAKAYAAQPEVAAKLEEFKVVSTGEDLAAQIAAVDNFINSGYDAVIVNAQNPAAFTPVIKRANAAGVVLVAFDNILDTDEAINVNVDQKGLGELWAKWLVAHIPEGGKILEVRGVQGTSVDRDRHEGIPRGARRFRQGLGCDRGDRYVGRRHRPEGDRRCGRGPQDLRRRHRPGRLDRHGPGSDGRRPSASSRWAARPRTASASFAASIPQDGLVCSSAGTGPAQVAVAIKTAIAALEGEVVPQSIKLPLAIVEDPSFKDGENYYSDQSDNFFVGNSFPTCGINFSAQEIMAQTKANQ